MPTRDDFKRMTAPILRGTAIGSALGILPGGGAILASFASYTVEKRISKTPEEFGKGAIAGVAGRNPPIMREHRHPSFPC